MDEICSHLDDINRKLLLKITEHFDAGANHVCVQLVVDQTEQDKFQNGLPMQQWQSLAESLL